MLEARELLLSNNILSLPVVDDMQRVRGMITLDDVGKASP
ncbi:MAG: acetoin utilization protein AcuB, partial [Phascolarctobacterium sp.]|nr:acetoin utilization protein AcuB [Phascolarctobacterium sp.]